MKKQPEEALFFHVVTTSSALVPEILVSRIRETEDVVPREWTYIRKEDLSRELQRLQIQVDNISSELTKLGQPKMKIRLSFNDDPRNPTLDANLYLYLYKIQGLVKLTGSITFLRPTNNLKYKLKNVNFQELFTVAANFSGGNGKYWRIWHVSFAQDQIDIYNEMWKFHENDTLHFNSIHLLKSPPRIVNLGVSEVESLRLTEERSPQSAVEELEAVIAQPSPPPSSALTDSASS